MKSEDWFDDPEARAALLEFRHELDAARAQHRDDPPLALLRAARNGVLPPEVQARAARYLADHPHTGPLLDADDEDEPSLSKADEDRLFASIQQTLSVPEPQDAAPPWSKPAAAVRRPSWKRIVVFGGAIAATVIVAVALGLGRTQRTVPPDAAVAGGPAAKVVPPRDLLQDGSQRITITQDGTVAGLDDVPEEYRPAVARTLADVRLETDAAVADILGKTGTLLGSADVTSQVVPLGPVGIAIESQRPSLQWSRVGGGSYQVSVFDEAYNPVAESRWLTTTQWSVPSPLARGKRYAWQIRVRAAGREIVVPSPPAPEARFRVLGDTEIDAVRQLRERDPKAHLVPAIIYARLGLFDDAERELAAARAQNPSSTVPQRLAADLDRVRGR